MKRLLSVLLALSLVFALIGCQPAGDDTTLSTVQTETSQPPETTEQTAGTEETQSQTEESTEQSSVPEETQALPVQTDPPTVPPTQFPEDTRPRPTEPVVPSQPQPTEPEETQPTQTEPPATTEPSVTTEPVVTTEATEVTEPTTESWLDPNGSYTSRDAVALYLHVYGHLPSNYITKSQAKSLYGSVSKIPSSMNIGGDRFYNKEGLLPDGHTYYECDIGTSGGSNRGTRRIVYSSDGLIYYTNDHYNSFTLLYGEP